RRSGPPRRARGRGGPGRTRARGLSDGRARRRWALPELPGQARIEAAKRLGLLFGRRTVALREIRARELVARPRVAGTPRDRLPKLGGRLTHSAPEDQRDPQVHTRLDVRGIDLERTDEVRHRFRGAPFRSASPRLPWSPASLGRSARARSKS